MLRRLGIALVFCALPTVGRAQDAPESLLPATTQVYLRWDGIQAHRAAYEKTALGQMMQGDTGKFVSGAFTQLQQSLGSALTVQQLLGGVPPERLEKMQADAVESVKLLNLLADNGLILAFEMTRLEPPEFQLTFVVPEAASKAGPLFSALRLSAAAAKLGIKEQKVGGRAVHHFQAEPVNLAWWVEGKHAVLAVGSAAPEALVQRLTGKGDRLTAAPLFKRVQAFNQFETGARAFIDVPAVLKIVRSQRKEVIQLFDSLGLDGLGEVAFYSGFDGPAERSLIEWSMPGPRKGALRLAGGKPFTLADVPPLPPDAVSWSMTNLDAPLVCDVATKAAQEVVALVDPNSLPQVKEVLQQIDRTLGVNLRDDLLASLGGQMVSYTSPAEGPLTLGQTFLFKVKNAQKLEEALDQAIRSLAKTVGAEVAVKKRTYRGVELREIHIRQEGFFFVPTYAVHNNWLVVAYFPQSVQGYILRATGELPAWKPGARVQRAFDKLPREFISVSVSDPVPSLKQILSVAPVIAALINSLNKEFQFDLGLLPNAHEATRHLFPNVTVVSDDGKTLRVQTQASLALPFDLAGLDTYTAFILFSLAARGF
jgi:hypothetical protein